MVCLSIKSTADDADTSNCELNVARDGWVLGDHWVLDGSWPALASMLLLWGMWTEEPLIPMRNKLGNHVTVPWLSAAQWSEQCTLGPYFGLILLSQTKTLKEAKSQRTRQTHPSCRCLPHGRSCDADWSLLLSQPPPDARCRHCLRRQYCSGGRGVHGLELDPWWCEGPPGIAKHDPAAGCWGHSWAV